MKCCIITNSIFLGDQVKLYLNDLFDSFYILTSNDYKQNKLQKISPDVYLIDIENQFFDDSQYFADDDSIVFYLENNKIIDSKLEAKIYFSLLRDQLQCHPLFVETLTEEIHIHNEIPTVVIFGSSGGIESLLNILSNVNKRNICIVVAQHIGSDGIPSLLSLIRSHAPLWEINISNEPTKFVPGRIIVCHPDTDIYIKGDGFILPKNPPDGCHKPRPSFNLLINCFNNCLDSYPFHFVFLSGIGDDGLAALEESEKLPFVVTESSETSAVSILPGAIKNGVEITADLASGEISQYINNI